jgi:hypothetical protein
MATEIVLQKGITWIIDQFSGVNGMRYTAKMDSVIASFQNIKKTRPHSRFDVLDSVLR